MPSEELDAELVEEVAAYLHRQWWGWSDDIAEEEDLSEERLERWKDECWMPYEDLPEHQKEDDRERARRLLRMIE